MAIEAVVGQIMHVSAHIDTHTYVMSCLIEKGLYFTQKVGRRKFTIQEYIA